VYTIQGPASRGLSACVVEQDV